MLKKLVVGAGVAVLLLGLFFGRDAASYVSTAFGKARRHVRESVPVGFDIERARKLITSLDGDIEQNMTLIAREEVEVAKLTREVDTQKEQLARGKEQILRLNGDLQSGTASFVYAGRSYSAEEVKSDLSHRFARFRTMEQTASKLEQILHARERGLDAARQKLEAMLASKRQLEVDIADLEARQKLVEVHKATSDFNFDDSRLSRTKELIEEISTRIEVAERLVNSQGDYHAEIPLDEESTGAADISDQITDYFGEGRAEVEALVGR